MARIIFKREHPQGNRKPAVYEGQGVNSAFESYGHDLKPDDLIQDR
jgi:hypothetical protein